MKINRQMAIAQLEILGYCDREPIYIRAFTPKVKGQTGSAKNISCKFPNLPWAELEELQDQGYGIYFVVNGGGNADKDVGTAKALFFEWDDIPIVEQISKWKTLNLPEPTMQISTRKSIHNYYKLAECPIAEWIEVQSSLLRFTKSDLKLKNPSRVMRLAGCWHIKQGEQPILCELIDQSKTALTIAQMRLIIPALEPVLEEIEAPRPQPVTVQAESISDFLENSVYPRLDAKRVYNWAGHDWQETQGGKLRGDCPFHDSSTGTAFWVEPSSDRKTYVWACPTCTDNHKSNPISYHHKLRGGNGSPVGKEFIEIVKDLASLAGVSLPQFERSPDVKRSSSPKKASAKEVEEMSFHDILDRVELLERATTDKLELAWIAQNFAIDNGLKSRGFDGKKLLEMVRDRREGTEHLEVEDAHDILESEQNPKFIVAGHLLEGTVTVVGAKGGTGKTTLLYDMAKHIATGKAWNSYRVRQGRCLIVQTDEPKPNIKQKLRIAHFENVPRGMIDFITKWRFSKYQQLDELVRKNKYRFIVIDSWTAAHAGLGIDLTKSSAGDNAYLLRDLAEDTGAAIVIVHHLSKMGDLRDSSTLSDNVSEVWKLSRGEDRDRLQSDERILSIEKSRSDLMGQYLLQQNGADYSWRHLGSLESPDLRGTEPLFARILQHFTKTEGGTLSAADICKEFGCDFEKATIELERLHRQGAIDCTWVQWRKDGHDRGFWNYIYRSNPDDPQINEQPEPIKNQIETEAEYF